MGDLKLTSASGSVTLSPENVAGTTTITVPSSTATLLTTSLSNLSATGEQKVCQAWVNFNGTGTVAIRDSFNVSSITDLSTGNYQINFTTNMGNNEYSATVSRSYSGGQGGNPQGIVIQESYFQVDSFRVNSFSGATSYDSSRVCAQVFGD